MSKSRRGGGGTREGNEVEDKRSHGKSQDQPEGRNLIRERQKMIRLADRSEYGLNLVNEYQADELAEDSDELRRQQRNKQLGRREVQV